MNHCDNDMFALADKQEYTIINYIINRAIIAYNEFPATRDMFICGYTSLCTGICHNNNIDL